MVSKGLLPCLKIPHIKKCRVFYQFMVLALVRFSHKLPGNRYDIAGDSMVLGRAINTALVVELSRPWNFFMNRQPQLALHVTAKE